MKLNIKKIRESLNVSQTELSRETGIERTSIVKWEGGKNIPNANDYEKIVKFFTSKGVIIDLFGSADIETGKIISETVSDLGNIRQQLDVVTAALIKAEKKLSHLTNLETSGSVSQPALLKGAGSSIPIDPVKKKLSGKRVLPSNDE